MSDEPSRRVDFDPMDGLLREWHERNRREARAGRDRLLTALACTPQRHGAGASVPSRRPNPLDILRSFLMSRYTHAAAALSALVVLSVILVPGSASVARADAILVPDGGRLDAFDDRGQLVGPCPLAHTGVDVSIAGRFTRVTVSQRYHNPYDDKVEAVYTFPLSHRSAVDRMTMTIGDRVVVGEVKERGEARRIYEQARRQGYVASLLEQERPNIFTQSVANIEPDAEVLVEISYVEMLESRDGLFTFDFPMVVGPRYIPGAATGSLPLVPAELVPRRGVVLRGPAGLTLGEAGDVDALGTLQVGRLERLLAAAQPIDYPGPAWWGQAPDTRLAPVWYTFEATYVDGSREIGWIHTDGTGQVNGRWFYTDPKLIKATGTGFAADTDQVADASRVTPMPVRPEERAGHDVSVRVTIDSGGPGLVEPRCALHEIVTVDRELRADGLPRRLTLELEDRATIPNRDFALSWRQTDEAIEDALFTHSGPDGDFFTLVLAPPARVAPEMIPPRELIFVLDTSGSMSGFPIEKAKSVMTRAIDAMRRGDTFNVVTFAGHTDVLWPAARPANQANRDEARAFVESRKGGGGTEMMKAIETALAPAPAEAHARPLTPRELADLPADGREVEVAVAGPDMIPVLQDGAAPSVVELRAGNDLALRGRISKWTLPGGPIVGLEPVDGRSFLMRGRWITENGRRLFEVAHATDAPEPAMTPMRVVMFLTDGYVGNDEAIVAAVRAHAGTTRVFSFGIGNSVNRFLLDGIARAGRGKAEFVLLESDADAAVERFARRLATPVLTDVEIRVEGDLVIDETFPPLDRVPDLYDVEPLVIHGRCAEAGAGTLAVRGRTGAGAWERAVEVDVTDDRDGPDHDVVATFWARAKVERLEAAEDVKAIVALGEEFSIMTKHTSFVAVEKSRLTIEGRARLVAVPIEMPEGVAWEGIFGGEMRQDEIRLGRAAQETAVKLGAKLNPTGVFDVASKGFMDGTSFSLIPTTGTVNYIQPVQLGYEAGPSGTPIAYFANTAGTPQTGYGVAGPVLEGWYDVNGWRVLTDVDDGQPAGADTSGGSNVTPATFGATQLKLNGTPMYRFIYTPDLADVPIPGDLPSLVLEKLARARESQGANDSNVATTLGLLTEGKDGNKKVVAGQIFIADSPGEPDALKNPSPVPAYRYAEEYVAKIGELAQAGQLEEATALLDVLGVVAPDYEGGLELREILGRPVVDAEAKQAEIEDLRCQAVETLEAAKAEAARRARLARVLDQRLWTLIARPAIVDKHEAAIPEADRALADQPTEATPEPILVSVLTSDRSPETVAALEAAGLLIQDWAEAAPHVVGRIAPERLAELALVTAVRRIEPV